MSAGITQTNENMASLGTLNKRRVRMLPIVGTASDHDALCRFLTLIFGAGYQAEFQAAVGNPYYEPSDRLYLRRIGQIIGHVQLTHRVMQVGSLEIPVAGLHGLATASECRGRGLGTHLVLAAEKQMLQAGALVGLLKTRIPDFFSRTGWVACGGSERWAASPHAVLSKLLENGISQTPRSRRKARIQVRPWRRWEECAIGRVYRQNLSRSFGLLDRNQAYWHWLLERRAYDQVYVALEGPDLWDLDETSTKVVGYAAIKGDRVLEIMAAPGCKRAAFELLSRACGDAIERDRRQVILHAAPNRGLFVPVDALGESSCTSGAEYGDVFMARLLNPLGLLCAMTGVYAKRAAKAMHSNPVELGLLIDGQKFQIEVTDKGCRATADAMGRSYLRMNGSDGTRLLLGQIDWDRALIEGRISPSTQVACDVGRTLFPQLPFWWSPLEDLTL